MGMPEIFISFQTAAVSAIARSARGVLALVLTDATEGGDAISTYRSLADVDKSKLPPPMCGFCSWPFWLHPAK